MDIDLRTIATKNIQMDSRKAIVATGYDVVAEQYLNWEGGAQVRLSYLEQFCDLVPVGARVLDIGCGAGIPVAKRFAQRFNVVGIDISTTQISLAKRNVPEACFMNIDMMAADFGPESFDGISAFFALTHLPREEHLPMLRRIAWWLRPGGVFLASMGVDDTVGEVDEDWLGTSMYFSHFDSGVNRRLVRDVGLEPFHEEIVVHTEDEVPVRFLWVIARKQVHGKFSG